MIFLEIAMIVIGLGAVIYSLRMSSDTKKSSTEELASNKERQKENLHLQSMFDTFTTKAETVYDNLEDKMSQMSNEKILGINEYSDQVLEKIEKNHEEVVFLYDMMNEKQEEIKELIHNVDTQKAELRDEAVMEYQKMKEQQKMLDEMKKEMEVDFLQFQTEQAKFHEEFEKLRNEFASLENKISDSKKRFQTDYMQNDSETIMQEDISSQEMEDIAEAIDKLDAFPEDIADIGEISPELLDIEETKKDISFDASVFDAEIARIEEEEIKEKANDTEITEKSGTASSNYQPLSEQEEIKNHNDEIVSLYKKGRSVLEISKMLSLGQGEVKFVIDLYNARL